MELSHANGVLFKYQWRYTNDPVLIEAAARLEDARKIVSEVFESLRDIANEHKPAPFVP
jgi:hypothetical protein